MLQPRANNLQPRCINLDWLEVFCKEDFQRDADFYMQKYEVKKRQYGTPQYREMFTIFKRGSPFLEIRRDPFSLKIAGGIFEIGSCHIRLTNNVLYRQNPVGELREFLVENNYRLQNITRIDVALDFRQFDSSYEDVGEFVKDYFKGVIAKINQSNISAHGKSMWDGNIFNSLKWGALKSNVTTKLYNKSMELENHPEKDYIKASWIAAGFNNIENVWRIEFGLKSFNEWVSQDGEFFANDLRQYDTRDKLLCLWYYLAERYFHFKKLVRDRTGKPQRKDRCPDVPLFSINNLSCYVPKRITIVPQEGRVEKMVIKYLEDLRANAPFSKTAAHCEQVLIAIRGRRALGIQWLD